MNSENQKSSTDTVRKKSLQLLPGIVIVIIQWFIWIGIPALVAEDSGVMIAVFGALICGFAIIIWWAFFSRAVIWERWGAILLIVVALLATSQIIDESIATSNMGLMFIFVSVPVMSLAFIIWAVASRNLHDRIRHITLVLTILIASGGWALIRSDGMSSHLHYDLKWRWAPTAEERFLARSGNETMESDTETEAEVIWPGFRGANRDGIVTGIRIKTNWKEYPPKIVWHNPVGPGCSSFAVSSEFIYTQEQRGDKEDVCCYNLKTGELVWIHEDVARFWDSHAGAGPRATPTLSKGHLYTLGATGILNALDALNGNLLWSHNVASETGARNSGWGFTASPVVFDSIVIAAASGNLAAYNTDNGNTLWIYSDSAKGYSSPQLIEINGISQVLLMSDAGATSFSPEKGNILWKYEWPQQDRILQPALIGDGEILFSGNMKGIRHVKVKYESSEWSVRELWTSNGFRPIFNDIVVHKGHAYGFDGLSLSCIDISDGKRTWKGGRYGGQIICLVDQDLLLVVSETGEMALISATPDEFRELTRFRAIKGKTWNHPVLAGDILLVRNSEEMAGFKLSLETN